MAKIIEIWYLLNLEGKMFKSKIELLKKFMKEDLPVIGVDLMIGGIRVAKEIQSRATKFIEDGHIPVPDFLSWMVKKDVQSDDDFYRVAEPEHDWDRPSTSICEKEPQEITEEKKETPESTTETKMIEKISRPLKNKNRPTRKKAQKGKKKTKKESLKI